MTVKTIIRKVVRNMAENTNCLKSNDTKAVRELKVVERAFKRAYKVDVEVRYVDAQYRELYKKKTVNGYYVSKRDVVVVFINGDTQRNKETLLHELTHAYQAQYMTKKFETSVRQKAQGKVSYWDSWHETHARHCARLLVNSLDFSIDLRVAESYGLAQDLYADNYYTA